MTKKLIKRCPRCNGELVYREFKLQGTFDGRDGLVHRSWGHKPVSLDDVLGGDYCDYSEKEA